MPILLIPLAVLVIIAVYVWSIYNSFVTTKTRIGASIQEIGNQLKRQSDLIPNLTEAVKGYMEHEKKIFADLTDARKSVSGALKSGKGQDLIDAQAKLASALTPIRAVFESTPELQASKPTVKLMDELRDTADKLMYSRRTLIDLTADYNITLVRFPSNLAGQLFGFKKEPGLRTPEEGEHLAVSKEETKSPKVKLS